MATLTWTDPAGERKSIALEKAAVLGRDPRADLALDFRGVSRRHALIRRQSGGYFLEDLGSTNGTIVNGSRIAKGLILQPGDRIQLGKIVLEFDAVGQANHANGRPTKYRATETLVRSPERRERPERPERRAEPEEELPRQLGKFLLLSKLGQGGMGSVYHARDLESSSEVALKIISGHIGRHEAFLEFFHNREAVLAREIGHPNVVGVYEHGFLEDKHWISMELVRGQNLHRILKRHRLQPTQILEIIRQVASGLAAAHRLGVVHSDIKPGNIVIDERFFAASGLEVDDAEGVEADDAGILEFQTDTRMLENLEVDRDADLREEIRRRSKEGALERLDDPPFFQRASEARFLGHYLERLRESRGFFLVVGGERGVGKRRLISEFLLSQERLAEQAAAAGDARKPRFLELDCSRIEGIPLLYEQVTGHKPPLNFNLRNTADELIRVVEALESPIVLRLLDFAAASTLACYLLDAFARHMERRPLLVIASLDPGEQNESSLKTLLHRNSALVKEIYLRPLTEYQIGRYMELLFETHDGKELAHNLYRLSEGNFTRIHELLRGFFERGILSFDASSGLVEYRPSRREYELEEGKNLYEQFRLYGRVEQKVLELGAFLGERFYFDALLRFHTLDETSLFFVVRQLLADGFLVEEERTWYRFTNQAFQRYLAERFPPPERPHMHRKIARLLQAGVPVPDSAWLWSLRGRHNAGCREYGRAVHAYLEGAHLARATYEEDLARRLYQEILQIYRELSRNERERNEVNKVLRDWFRRDGNWYEILGGLGARIEQAYVKIADFGISFRTADEERGYQVGKRPILGTPRYISPERGRGGYGGPPSDIFALGVISYEMVVGKPPFPELKKFRVVKAYQVKPVRMPSKYLSRMPKGFEALFQGMVAMNPDERWDAERVLREVVKLQFDLLPGR